MPHCTLPTLRARRFAFDAGGCLYRDHLGRRVLADAEGCGRLEIETAAPGLATDAAADGTFEDGLIAATAEDGPSTLSILRGGLEALPDLAEGIDVRGSFEGAGWVLASEGPLQVDGLREEAPLPASSLPIPFFLEACAATLTVVRRDFRALPIDRFSIADAGALKERGFRVQNMSDIEPLDGFFPNGESRVAPVASHLNTASWSVELPAEAFAVVLRKIYDRFHGRQRARVLLNGLPAGTWYEPEENRVARWAISDFCARVPEDGGSALRIAIDPVAGSPLWSVAEMEVFALVRK
ncbi:MAG: hypothetical protein M9921_08460 [Fimbriimonadaceae bacterium]|nr:hypothetical protein [Chthonomonadaceae bacterium]MCO5296875.1 hypothetical protein [Fimbriimonadaceae bacterium]